ncbi:MAG: DUF3857 and transglutaminase domain-containing protein [Bacteroidetes bacterium]|nr:DUF3857 and transglutaminase domain-containing protein [Bacteroidota bacterium]
MRGSLIGLLFLLVFTAVQAQMEPGYVLTSEDLTYALGAKSLVLEEARQIRFSPKGSIEIKVKKATMILEPDTGFERALLYYDKDSKVVDLEARVFDKYGQYIRTIREKDFEDYSVNAFQAEVSDGRYKTKEITHREYPYTIELSYVLKLDGFAKMHYLEWSVVAGYGQALRQARMDIIAPSDLSVNFLPVNIDLKPRASETDNENRYAFEVSKLHPIPYESLSGPASDVLPALWVLPRQFSLDGYDGSLASWKDFGAFINKLADDRQELPEEVRNQVFSLTANVSSDREKVEILYDYMQSEMRYVSIQLGVGGWQPLSAEYVSEHKYGDCKALTNYMRAMLKEVGIESAPVVIYRGRDPASNFDALLPSLQFNHMLLYVPEEELFLECTSGNYPAGFIGSDNENRKALLIEKSGGRLIDMPVSEASENQEIRKMRMEVEADGRALLDVESVYTGSRYQYYQWIKQELTEIDQEVQLRQGLFLPAFELKGWSLEIEKEEPKATIRLQLDVERFVTVAGSRLFVQLCPLVDMDIVPAESTDRSRNALIREAWKASDEIMITLPEGYAIENMPKQEDRLETAFATYARTVRVETGVIYVTRNLEVLQGEVPASEYDSWRQFFVDVVRKDREFVVLVKE